MSTTTDAARATAQALPDISRRRFLMNTTLAGAAVAVAAPAVAAEPEIHPIDRLHALHDEASELMAVHNEYLGGEWELRIRAPYDRCPIIYKNLKSDPEKSPREQAIWHMRELEKLLRSDGATKMHVCIVGEYSVGDCRAFAIQDSGKFIDRDGLFAEKGGVA